ncbi:MAG TPA: universal stress protein [Polyangiaceae bacterium]|nr:universal stress protein [Polyangiaceae bacterium]
MVGSTSGNTNEESVILVALDLSPVSEAVMRAAVNVTAARSTELHLLHVLRSPAAEPVATLHVATDVEKAKAELTQLARDLPRTVKRVVIHLRVGTAEVEIAQLASDLGADLIVVGTHGYKGIDRVLLGSVAEGLIRNAPCPVFTYRPKTVRLWERIEPPCPDCLAVRQVTGRATLWCERHSQHHPRAHTYSEIPPSYGMGAQTFR